MRLLQLAVAGSAFDRFAVTSLLVTIAADLQAPLSRATAAASLYFLLYGLTQPVWGLVNDRFGRVRTMRLALALAAGGALASTAALNLVWLVVARACTGSAMAAVVPTALTYIGDTVPLQRRHRVLTDLTAATAIGLTAAIALGGLLAATLSWRTAFAVPGVLAAALAVVLRSLPEPRRAPAAVSGVRTVLADRWARLVLALTLVEGAVLLGLLSYLAPAMETAGYRPEVAGSVVAVYGVGLLGASRVVKRITGRVRPPVFLAGGSAGLVAAYAAVAINRSGPTVALSALLLGAGMATLHSTMQTWATELVPDARAVMVSLFACVLFVGSAVAAAAGAPLVGQGRWGLLFGLGAATAALFGTAAAVGRRRYGAERPA